MIMKKIGIVGGLSPASTLAYYQLLTQLWRERSRGYHYPEIIIYSGNSNSTSPAMPKAT